MATIDILSAPIDSHIRAFLAGTAPLSIDLVHILYAVEPLGCADSLASLPLPALSERLALLLDVALVLGRDWTVCDGLLGLLEVLGNLDNRRLKSKREVVDFIRHGKNADSTVIAATATGGLLVTSVAASVRAATIVHRLKKVAKVYSSLHVADAVVKLQVGNVEDLVQAATWSQRTKGVPSVTVQVVGEWLRLK